jgi:hypothetical protein
MQSAQTTIVNDEEKQLLNALLALQIQQDGIEIISSSEDAPHNYDRDFLNTLIDRIDDDVPAVISSYNHAVNAINIIEDLHDHNRYYVGIYNSNFPGQISIFTMRCSKISCLTEDYDFGESALKDGSDFYMDGRPLFMPKSLDEEVNYFNRANNN